jgi:hypothetical protein
VTGANGSLIVTQAEAKLGDLAWIHTEGGLETHIEASVLRPLLRGSDIEAWRADIKQFVIFCHHDDTGAYLPPPRSTARFLRAHNVVDGKGRLGALQTVVSPVGITRVAWHDLASTLKGVVLPGRGACLGMTRPVVPLNTTYFITLAEPDAHLLAAYFNSLPLRVFARAIAERAKDAHFRFFACTMALLPLPLAWKTSHTDTLLEVSHACHADGAITPAKQHELDELIGGIYGLNTAAMSALRRFDQWLRGENE